MGKIIKPLFFVGIFLSAILFWYSPVIFKGYTVYEVPKSIILARNYYQTGVLADQNNLNETMAPGMIKESGHPLVMSENLGAVFYAKIFKLVGGIPSYHNLILISLFLYALAMVLFTYLVLRLFNFKTAIVFSLIYILIPFSWMTTYSIGQYEFCFLFWSMFFIFFFLGIKRNDNLSILLFIISGFFLAISGLSKEVVLVFALALFVYLLAKKKKKELLSVFIPFICLLVIFWLPSLVKGENQYAQMLGLGSEESNFSDRFHVYPDPYTYFHDKEQFLAKLKSENLGLAENLETKKLLANYNLDRITLFERAKIGTYIFIQHIFRFFSLQEFGGPFLFLVMLLGFIYIRKRYDFIYGLFKYWLVISLLIFSYIVMVSRSHLMDFVWPLVLLVSLGLIYLADILKEHFKLDAKKGLLLVVLIICLFSYFLFLVDRIVLGDMYDKDFVPRSIAYAEIIDGANIKDEDIIAVPGDFPAQIATLNYLTNKSFVVFQSSTLDKLASEGKVEQAFEAFNVKYILGYSDKLSSDIVNQTGATNIASESLEFDIKKTSENKNFLMNLIR